MTGGLKIVFGTAGFRTGGQFPDAASAKAILDVVQQHGVKVLDTAQLYGESEAILGELHAADSFTIDSKAQGGFDRGVSLKPDQLYKDAHDSLAKLKTTQLDIFYIHAPDPTIPPSVWLPVVDKLHKEGVFRRLGVSNFTVAELDEVVAVAREKGLLAPSVYQGNYSAVTRRQETELFPRLRELGIAFYAYSPLAGGFLAKTKKGLLAGADAGRFADDKSPLAELYRSLYFKPAYLDALDAWTAAAQEQGVSQAELAYRWLSYHSPLSNERGDAIIFGASRIQQAEQTITGLQRGPLEESVVKKIDEVWESIKHEAPLDNYNDVMKGTQ